MDFFLICSRVCTTYVSLFKGMFFSSASSDSKNTTPVRIRVVEANCDCLKSCCSSSFVGTDRRDQRMGCRSEKLDTLTSSIPEDVLSHILSLMPTKYAVQTSLLSKRWRYLWMSVTNLDFDDIRNIDDLKCLTECLDRVLKLCTTSQLKLFRLPFKGFWPPESSISRLIREAVRFNIHELDIECFAIEVPMILFTCKTLTTLRLVCGRVLYCSDAWKSLPTVDLPNLKTLEIAVSGESCVNILEIVHGCPLLENLSMRLWFDVQEEFNFSIPTLKRLKLIRSENVKHFTKFILNTPNLEYLYLGGVLCSLYVIEDCSSLVEATVSFYDVRYDDLLVELLRVIHGVKLLSWSCPTIHVMDLLKCSSMVFEWPKFSKLKRLEMRTCLDSGLWLQMVQFLECAPELEYLSIEKEPKCDCWMELRVPTKCDC